MNIDIFLRLFCRMSPSWFRRFRPDTRWKKTFIDCPDNFECDAKAGLQTAWREYKSGEIHPIETLWDKQEK